MTYTSKFLFRPVSSAQRAVASAAITKRATLHDQRRTVTKLLTGILLGVLLASPAKADDWSLKCEYEEGVVLRIKYSAGDPSHSVGVLSNGGSMLALTPQVPAARMTAPDRYTFIVDRERTGRANEHSLLIRLHTDTMRSSLEGGNGVSWDYISLSGKCAEE